MLLVLLCRMNAGAAAQPNAFSTQEKEAIDRLLSMLSEIQEVKQQANLPAGRSRTLLDQAIQHQ